MIKLTGCVVGLTTDSAGKKRDEVEDPYPMYQLPGTIPSKDESINRGSLKGIVNGNLYLLDQTDFCVQIFNGWALWACVDSSVRVGQGVSCISN